MCARAKTDVPSTPAAYFMELPKKEAHDTQPLAMVAKTLVMVKAAGVVDVIGVATAAAPTAAGRGGVRSASTPMVCNILQALSFCHKEVTVQLI